MVNLHASISADTSTSSPSVCALASPCTPQTVVLRAGQSNTVDNVASAPACTYTSPTETTPAILQATMIVVQLLHEIQMTLLTSVTEQAGG